jgi:membrane dipeptidase
MALTRNFAHINIPNCFGYPNSPDFQHQGLTAFGKEAVIHMQELGMLVDVSHLSDQGFWDVADCTSKPFIASHSNCREVCGLLRNLDDDMIRTLANRGGIAGLNFCPDLTIKNATHCNADDLAKHVCHLLQVGGEDCIALGTDFDGIGGTVEVDSPTKMPLLFHALKKQGLTERQLDKFAWGNAMRVLKETL